MKREGGREREGEGEGDKRERQKVANSDNYTINNSVIDTSL